MSEGTVDMRIDPARAKTLVSNLQYVSGLISSRAQGRNVRLVAVSKLKPAADILALHQELNHEHFGENYAQELTEKAEVLPKSIKWHFIGGLQSNKCKPLASTIPNLWVVSSIDSIKKATQLDLGRASLTPHATTPLYVHVQVNTSGEEAKSGCQPGAETLELCRHIKENCANLQLLGLMTIGAIARSQATTPENENEDFVALTRERDALVKELGGELELSMGMSDDFEGAVAMGSGEVRVGSTIFGARPAKADFSVKKNASYIPILANQSPDNTPKAKHGDGIPGRSLQISQRHCVLPRSQRRDFHNYFVTHLPSSSLHPDSRSPHHKLPRAASIPHTGASPPPTAVPPLASSSRDLTVVRIPIQSAKHHFGAKTSRGTRPYNEDRFEAGTIEIPAFASRVPISLTRSDTGFVQGLEATSADSASGDPQVFYFGVFDGHGGSECSEFLKHELHNYVEDAAKQFGLQSSLKRSPDSMEDPTMLTAVPQVAVATEGGLSKEGKKSLNAVDMKTKEETKPSDTRSPKEQVAERPPDVERLKSEDPLRQRMDKPKALELEASLLDQWKSSVGGYFRRFKPDYFDVKVKYQHRNHKTTSVPASPETPPSIETVLMYAFLRCDLDFVIAQASKPDKESISDLPLNNDEVLGRPSKPAHSIGGPTRFKGGSTASIAMISTPTPTPFWHPSSPSTLLVAHVGDTRILLCDTATGLAVPTTTNHHPSSPIESTRLHRYAATFVTDSFGEERMSGLANTRAFGDMKSKRIGVSAEPEIVRVALAPAQYSFVVLVSDGVSGTLTDQEIVDIVKEAKTPEQGAQDVVTFATETTKDGDNATCLVVRLGGWERRGEGGSGSLGTKEVRDFRRQDATDPRRNRR
ncbi:hypothetical protein V502_10847 [Pseudogymnoascus sp. VKM F-4520 (FW-2644)]|nr:hypothetical protein V502_10847 [Pseudogymnoascus sp. VKM F-4520 (FW-2644)]